MSDTKNESIETAIWLTAHCRMIAERRYRWYDTLSHIQLSWLALTGITWAVARSAWAVAGSPTQHTVFLDTYTAILSVLVFAFSIVIFGFRFGETASSYRECYLRLQKLHDCKSGTAELTKEYHEILGAYPNHGDWDFEAMVIEKTLIRKGQLQDRSGRPIQLGAMVVAKHALLSMCFWTSNLAVFSLGLLPYYYIFQGMP